MKILFSILLILIIQSDYHNFLKFFPDNSLNTNVYFFSRKLSSFDYDELSKRYNLIEDNYSFRYLCDMDSSKFQFKYSLYNMDEDRFEKPHKEKYKHYAIALWKKKEYDLVIFSKFNYKAEKFIMRSFMKGGDMKDELIVNDYRYSGTGMMAKDFCFSLISKDGVKIWRFKALEGSNGEDDSGPKTMVLLDNYAIDDSGRFTRISQDSLMLSHPLMEYADFTQMPLTDDPSRKYWTPN